MPYDTEEHLSAALHEVVQDRPFTPDVDRIEERGRKLRQRRLAWRVTGGAGFAVAAVAAVAVAASGSGVHAPAREVAGPVPASSPAKAPSAPETPLVQLVGYLTTAAPPAGDATVVLRDQKYSSGLRVKVYDLWADNGDSYFAKTKAGLPAQVKGHKTQGDDQYKREVAAAKYAATGDLNVARKRMIAAVNPSAKQPTEKPGYIVPLPPSSSKLPADVRTMLQVNHADNWLWGNSIDALHAGAGDPKVRAGVLRLLSMLPEVKVTSGTLDGKATLTLSAGKPAFPIQETENFTIDATTGVPLKFFNGDKSVVVTYTVTRVKLADVAKGTF
jgi:hypothetical protein